MFVLSEHEEYSGEIYDPKNATEKIDQANAVINKFIKDMQERRIPEADLDCIASATEVLGLYAGYTGEAADMESYIRSEFAVINPAIKYICHAA